MEGQLSGRVDQCVPRWFGHVERMAEASKCSLVTSVYTFVCRCWPVSKKKIKQRSDEWVGLFFQKWIKPTTVHPR